MKTKTRIFILTLAVLCFVLLDCFSCLASAYNAENGEYICRIIEAIHVGDDRMITYTLCLENEAKCGYEAGRYCAIGLSKETIRKTCGWVHKSQCKSGSKQHRLRQN